MEDLDALLADLQFTSPPRCPVLLTDSSEKLETSETRPPPPSYDPKITMSYSAPGLEIIPVNKEHLYSTVQKPPASSASPVVGGGLCELDRLLNELNATQFNITDEIMSQFPPRKSSAEKTDEERSLSATSATLELDRLMASLSDFHKQNTASHFQPELEKHLDSKDDALSSPRRAEVLLDPRDSEGSNPRLVEEVSGPRCLDELPAPRGSQVMSFPRGVEVTSGPARAAISALGCPEKESGPKHLEVVSGSTAPEVVPGLGHPEVVPGLGHPEVVPGGRGDLDSMLVQLKSGLQLQGIETQSKGLCVSCQRPIAGQVVTALGHTWHPEHFVCAHCHTLIGSTNFFEKDGQPYCERDYFALHAPRCALCDLPILKNMVTALGHTWHPEHFCCKICKKPIGEEGFHEKNGEQYCADDFFRLFGAVCSGCSAPVKESYISALGSLWHPQCFVCHVCKSPFLSGSFFENDGLPLCETHYHSVRGSLCAGCEQPITGRCVTAMGRKFHPHHLSCTFCLRQLNKGTFREQDGKPYCQACYGRLYG
ncbi:transforming growth factor beta-1-induced transcript 1 protein [Discoglossus pictus]